LKGGEEGGWRWRREVLEVERKVGERRMGFVDTIAPLLILSPPTPPAKLSDPPFTLITFNPFPSCT